MAKSESPLFDGKDTWFTGHVTPKSDRVVVKLYEDGIKFVESIIIPSVRFPLSGHYEIFDYTNTHEIGTAENEDEILNIFNSVKFEVGMCYFNADRLTQALCKAGYDAQTYVGWLFAPQITHHAWTVLRQGETISVLDLADNVCALIELDAADVNLPIQQQREAMAKAMKILMKRSNSDRCYPVGIPAPLYLYVGSPCTGTDGLNEYIKLMNQFPNHPAYPAQGLGKGTETQKMILDAIK